MSIIRQIHPLAVFPALLWLGTLACAASHHPTQPADLGKASASQEMLDVIPVPGPVEFQSLKAADWVVARSGLINLDHPAAQRAGLEDGDEPIELYFYVLQHPKFGMYIVDTGVEVRFIEADSSPQLSWIVKTAMKMETLDVQTTTAEWLARQPSPLAGVFLTHIHLDHIMGLPDIPKSTPVYTGPGEPGATEGLNAFSQGTTDRFFSDLGALREWPFEPDPADRFAGVLDVFGDGSLWALHVPGHTPGSTAFLVRTPNGPELLLGDATHTRWGWENGVEPGSFSLDQEQSAKSLKTLLDLAARFPQMPVHPGHQGL